MQLIAFGFIVGAVLLSTDAFKETICGKRLIQHEERNSGDHSTDAGDWPWNAAIYHLSDESKIYKCAGTLIHTSVVLTAARCVFENSRKIIARRVQVELGRHNLNDAGSNVQEFQVHEIIPHPSFNPSTLENDIAIIRLSTEAALNDFVQPICLWQSNVTDLSEVKNELGTVIGWGIIQTTTPQRSDELQQTLMPVITKTNCVSSKADFFDKFLFETSFCAGSRDGTNPCNGDSGASMIFKEKGVHRIRGIVSRGVPKDGQINVCDPHEYFIFTDVVHFIPWIEEVVPELNWNRTTPANVSTTAVKVSAVCGFNEEFAVDKYRCEQSCEEYGDPLCVGNATEGRCYCKEGSVRLKARGICVAADNLACRAKMPPTKETCDRRQNEELSIWLHDEPCANTCENYNVPCNITSPAGMIYGPHCVCKEGFARLPNGKCVDVGVTNCRELWIPRWNPSTTPTPITTSTHIPTTTSTPIPTTQIVPATATPIPTSANVSVVCGFNEEFAVDKYRCEQSCEEYGDPLCVGNATEGRCYCKEGFVRLKARGICVAADNLACRAKMPPTKETCDKRQNEELSLWLHDEPCANTCENYNVPCNATPPAGIFYAPHCVCKKGFSRLSNGKCVDVNDTECRELWNHSKSTTLAASTRILQTTVITTNSSSTTTAHIVPKTPATPNPISVRVTEHHPPEQTPQPSIAPYEVAIGERIEMRCSIDGRNRSTTWRRADGRPLPRGAHLYAGTFVIDVITHDAAGYYECTVRDCEDEIKALLRTQIVVIELPQITFVPSTMPMVVQSGDTFEIDCNVTSEQPIRVHWHKVDFRPLPPSVDVRGNSLEFTHITPKDAGRYYCTAENIHRRVTKVAEVIIVNRNEISDQVQNVCIAKNPCKNDGVCQPKGHDFVCDCPVGYTGDLCQHASINPSVSLDCHMEGNGYIELNWSEFADGPTQKAIVIALMFSTRHANGLLCWYGQNKHESYNGQDFVALAVVKGYLEYSFRLNGEEAKIKNVQTQVDDGEQHIAIITRSGNLGTLELDGLSIYGESRLAGELESYLPGNVFFGGAPDLYNFTGTRYTHGFHGCIHVIEGPSDQQIHLGKNAVSGLNVDQCPHADDTTYLD